MSSWRSKPRELVLFKCLKVLPQRDRSKIPFVIALQVLLALADLLAVGVIGIIAALSISGIQSTAPNPQVIELVEILRLDNLGLQAQATILGVFATTLLISRTVASVIITRRTLIFLSNRSAGIASDIFTRLTSQSLTQLQSRSTQESIYAITGGTSAITLGIIGAFLSTFADAVVALVLITGLFFLNPVMAFSMLIFFGFTAMLLYRLMSSRSHSLGVVQATQSIAANEIITEAMSSYRELIVRNRRDFYARKLKRNRYESADVYARLQFLPNISKYIIEVLIVLGALFLSAYEFLVQDANSAIAVLAVFLASATRIAPAIMRIQQSAISIKGAAGGAERTLKVIEQLAEVAIIPVVSDIPGFTHQFFEPSIIIENVCFTYPGSQSPTINDINLQIVPGSLVAIVGPSGAGKTTLVDIILGVINPESGLIQLSGHPPLSAISSWPGAVSYVPQDILITSGTIAENVAFGFPLDEIPKYRIAEAISFSGLQDFVDGLPDKYETQVGERGTKLSGGQRQRLGIARAVLTNPKLLVLDEATSTLDAQTELLIADAIKNLKGKVTIVMIAHRLSTVTNADLIIYMDKGEIKAQGSMSEVRNAVPNFDLQAKLMGL